MEDKEFCLEDEERIRFIEGIGLNLHYYKPSDVKKAIKIIERKGHFVCGRKMVYIDDIKKTMGEKLI